MKDKESILLKKNSTQLLLIVSPMIGFLYRLTSLPLSLGFLCGILLGLPLALACHKLVRFRIWLFTALLIGAYGIFLILTWDSSAFGIIGAILFGFSSASLLLLMPQLVLIEEYKKNGLISLCLFWTLAICLGLFLSNIAKLLEERFIYYYLLFFLLESTIFIHRLSLRLYVNTIEEPLSYEPQIIYKRNKAIQIKLFSSSLMVNFILFTSLFIYAKLAAINLDFSCGNYFLSGIFIGIFLSQAILKYHSIISLFVSIILFTQLSTAILFSTEEANLLIFGIFILGLSFGQWLISISLMPYHLIGPVYYAQCLTIELISLPIAIIAALIFILYTAPSYTFYLFTNCLFIFLLIFSFFTIFSAWKRRLVLLRPSDICYT